MTLTKPYYIGKFEVTQEQYQEVMGSNPSLFKGRDLPVECVFWDDTQEFCKKATRSAGFQPAPDAGKMPALHAALLAFEAERPLELRAALVQAPAQRAFGNAQDRGGLLRRAAFDRHQRHRRERRGAGRRGPG